MEEINQVVENVTAVSTAALPALILTASASIIAPSAPPSAAAVVNIGSFAFTFILRDSDERLNSTARCPEPQVS